MATNQRYALLPSATVTASGQSGPFQVGDVFELLVFVNVALVSGTTPTLNVFIDTSFDGDSTWTQVCASTQITAIGQQVFALGAGVAALNGVASGIPFGDTIRVRYALGGTTPSFTVAISAVGK